MLRDKNGIRKYEHRIVMEEHLGRELLSTETVHHIDGDRLNNSLENLELVLSHSDHMAEHHMLNRDPKTGQFLKKGKV
jgi:hypothetical protein